MTDLVAGAENQAPAEPTPLDLLPNDMMRLFVEDYVTGCYSGKRFNRSAAARAAGYAEDANTGMRLYRRPDVKAAIDYLLNQTSISPQEIENRLIEMATAEVGELVEVNEETGLPSFAWRKLEKYKHLIKNFYIDSNGNPRVEFYDAHAALKDLIRVRGMAKEGVELSGPGGSAVPVQISVNFVSPHLRRVDTAEEQTALPAGDEE